MENRTNQVIKLANNKEYLVLRQVIYKNETYYVTTEISNEGETYDENLTVLKETEEDNKKFLNIINNPSVISTIMSHIA